jgi:putative toxin-antitoxin system antitoxin component (TIGR02293 family)
MDASGGRWKKMTEYRAKSIAELGALVVKEARPGYAGPSRLESVRQAVEEGLPVEAVKQLQAELKRFGVRRPSEYVDSIVSRATLQRRDRLKPAEGEQIVRVAALLATAADIWGDEEDAGAFLTSPHPMLGGAVPIDLARSEIGARQVERILLAMDLGLPV